MRTDQVPPVRNTVFASRIVAITANTMDLDSFYFHHKDYGRNQIDIL